MFSTSLLWIASVVALATADGHSQCTTGQIVCCNSLTSADAVPDLFSVTGLLATQAGLLGNVGVRCSTLTVIGEGKSCIASQQPLCCTDNNYNGLFSLGCSPINAMLV
ncbi:fungal hydrophobin [Paxillus involutus ATCC 200175]|uniref:Hydrophobin n=4 Tax=Agaricomycetidae TaxID=452333 RepID=A0A0C9U9E2_PAXIN|nr:hydrophobin [Paxillus involutus]ABG66319.1 hydrophobin [Paxillus involutus]KIJ15947.1 fungal hydrophobin [Paxillus involutus ATCC 200175]